MLIFTVGFILGGVFGVALLALFVGAYRRDDEDE
jgi:hypothetical protein